MKKRINITASIILKAALLSIAFVVPAFASYLPFNTNVRMNVGIGSANPGQSLDVQGTVRATAFIGNGSGLTNLSGTTQWTTTNTNDVYLPNNGNVGLGTTKTSTAALSIMNGNVGIGTWVPNALLNVNGGVMLGYVGNDAAITIYGSGRTIGSGGGNFMDFGNVFNVNNGSSPVALNLGGNLNFSSSFGTTNTGDTTLTRISAGNIGVGTSGAGTGQINGNLMLGNVGIGTTLIGGSGEAALTVMNGNVGIGTWVPSAPLYVNGNTFINGNLNFTNNTGVNGSGNTLGLFAGGTNQALLTNASLTLGQGGQAYPFTIGLGTGSGSNYNAGSLTLSSGIGTGSGTAGSIIFQTANVLGSGSTTQSLSTKMTLQGNGNVGIGTSVPAGVLEIVGNVGIGTISYSPYVTTTPPNGGMVVEGNVGIGTWIPSASLDVMGTISSNPSATINVTAGGGITVTRAIMRIQGNGGAVTVTANPEIAAGQDGQVVVLEGMSSANTVKLTNGTGLKMAGGISFTLGQGAMITFVYDAVNNVWTETSRSAN